MIFYASTCGWCLTQFLCLPDGFNLAQEDLDLAWNHGFAAMDPKGEKEWEGGDKRAASEGALHSIREAAEEDARWSYSDQGHFSLMKCNIFKLTWPPTKGPRKSIKDVFLPHFWDSSWTCGAIPSGKLAMKCFPFLFLSLLDGFPCTSNLKHRHVLDSLVSAAFDVRMCSIRCSFWKVTPQSLRVSCIQVMLCARPCLEAIMRFQWPTQCVCNPGTKNMLRCVLQRVVKLPSKISAALQLWSYSASLMYVILLFTSFQGLALTDSQTPSSATTA